jgi:predicted metal-dependent HD superfamily phosphohydrolase
MSTLTSPLAQIPEGLLRTARVVHAHPPRAYHDFDHVEDVLTHLAEAAADGHELAQPVEVHLAALFHDAVYIAGRSDNEQRSADFAAETIATFMPARQPDVDRVRHLIYLTARHGRLTAADLDPDAALFVDADMAIIGAPRPDFDRYEAAITEEYRGTVPSLLFRFYRRRFLARLLAAERIFYSPDFHARLDAPARRNLRRVLSR